MIELNAYDGETGTFLCKLEVERPGNLSSGSEGKRGRNLQEDQGELTMVATREKWETASSLPRGASYEQMLEFFGIPPSTAEALDDNISKKRRRWNHMSNSGNPAGRKKAAEVLELIQRISQAVKRGMADDQGGGAETEIPASVFETLEELWRILSEYVFADEYDDALRVAREAVSRWRNADAASALSPGSFANLVNDAGFAHPQLVAEGLEAARFAVPEQPGEVRNWESDRGPAAGQFQGPGRCRPPSTRPSAPPAAGPPPCSTCSAPGRWSTLKRPTRRWRPRCARSPGPSPRVAAAIRSEATELLVSWAATMLPIKSDADLIRYTRDDRRRRLVLLRGARGGGQGAGLPDVGDQRGQAGLRRLRPDAVVPRGHHRVHLPADPQPPSLAAGLAGLQRGTGQGATEAFFIVAAPAYVQKIHNVNLGLSFQGE